MILYSHEVIICPKDIIILPQYVIILQKVKGHFCYLKFQMKGGVKILNDEKDSPHDFLEIGSHNLATGYRYMVI